MTACLRTTRIGLPLHGTVMRAVGKSGWLLCIQASGRNQVYSLVFVIGSFLQFSLVVGVFLPHAACHWLWLLPFVVASRCFRMVYLTLSFSFHCLLIYAVADAFV